MQRFGITTFRFDRTADEPYHRQIYVEIRAAIMAGRLRPGERLPSTRELAHALGISRLPTVNAYEQLRHEGYIVGKAGSGSYVNDAIPDELAEIAPAPPKKGLTPPAGAANAHRLSALRVSLPAVDEFPIALWSRLVARKARALTKKQMAYGDPAGHGPLRAAIADYLQTVRGVRCDPGQVLIVSGSQMALQLCALTLLGPGTAACIEDPGYLGAREALTRGGARIIPVRVDGEGIDAADLPRRRKNVRAVYVTPSHQYPLGVSMTASRRLALLEWARHTGAWIIEDDYDSEYRYASRPLAALQGMDPAAQIIYIGTFSKVLFPSLRIGYVVVPPQLMAAFLRNREAIDLFSPVLEQVVLTEFFMEGHFGRHVRRMRALYEKRRDALVRSLRLYAALHPHNSEAGLHITTFLPPKLNDHDVVRQAASVGIDVMALSDCYLGRHRRNGLILGFGGGTEEEIADACRKLGAILGHAPRRARHTLESR